MADEERPRRRPEPPPSRPAGREPPHSVELERAVLAAVLDGRNATAIHVVRERIAHPLVFWQRDHRIVYLACLELDDQGVRPDAQAVAELLSRYPFQAALDRLRRSQELLDAEGPGPARSDFKKLWQRSPDEQAGFEDSALASIGGFNAVLELVAAGAFGDLKRSVELLLDYHGKRRLIARITQLSDRAHRTTDAVGKLLEEAGQVVLELGKDGAAAGGLHSIGGVVEETLTSIVDRNANPEQGVRTGIEDVDKRLMSLRPGGLYVLAARPGVGKTSFALKVLANIASHPEQARRVLFFSLEVDRVDLLKKLLAAESGVEFSRLESGAIDPDHWERLRLTCDRFKEWPVDLMDVSDLTVHGLRAVVKRRDLELQSLGLGRIELVVLDYLQLLGSTRSDATEYEKVSEISRVLKVMARDLRIPVMALSQMSRDSEKGGAKPREPRLSDLRGSGSIEQDADAVVFLHRVDNSDGGGGEDESRRIKVVVAKNRFGPTGDAHMLFFPAKMKFEQAAPWDDEDDEGGGNGNGGARPPPASPQQREQNTDRRERRGEAPSEGEDLFR